jgi:hypothetical protein
LYLPPFQVTDGQLGLSIMSLIGKNSSIKLRLTRSGIF